MRAAIALLGQAEPGPRGRRIAVLGDMLELGSQSALLHRELAQAVTENSVDLVFCSGPEMRNLWDALPSNRRGGYATDSGALEPRVLEAVTSGDAVMVKGSFGSKMAPIVKALQRKFTAARCEGRSARLIRCFIGSPIIPTSSSSSICFRYITLRTGGALMTAAVFMFIAGSPIIDWLRAAQGKGQPIRDRRPAIASEEQDRHADHGRPDDHLCGDGLDGAVGQSRQPLCLDRARRHAGFRDDRLLRRLSEGDQAAGLYELLRQAAPHRRDHRCDPRVPCDLAARPAGLRDLARPFRSSRT